MGSTVEAIMNPESQAPDRELVTQARDGERDAREELAQRAGRSAYVFALQLTRSPDTANDIAQESVFRFFRRLDRFDPEQPIEPWLYGIVRNQVRDAARRDKVRKHESLDRWLEAGGPEPAAGDDPAASAERHELQQRVWRGISQLNEAQREILVLRDFNGLAYREIAEVLSIPTGTVMSRLHAARQRLRQILIEQEGGPLSDTVFRRSEP
jgi:RNA polymerase sigma-70 factor (ECF subfamily)